MAKILTFLILLGLRIFTGESIHPEPAFATAVQETFGRSKLISFTGMLRENRIQLQWIISGNETVDRFEVEKSADKKNFSLAALVFCSDKMDTDHYQLLETSPGKKIYYRIKVINKDGTTSYSSAIEIDPSAKPEPIEQTKTNSYAEYC